MNRWMSCVLAVLVGCSAFVLQSGQAALASSGPVITPFAYSGSFVDTELCGFPIRVSWQQEGRDYEWFDSQGNLRRFVRHSVFSEVARANGKSATGIDRQTFTDNQQGSFVLTGSWIFFLPDGSHIQNAGRIQISSDGSGILSEHGPHPIEEGRLAELFCPAMR